MVDALEKRRLSTWDIVELTGLSRHQVYPMKKRHGWGRWVYRGQLVRDLPELWASIVFADQLEHHEGAVAPGSMGSRASP